MSGTGRAEKLILERRLEIATRGSTLLDRKQRIMADELDRLQLQADRVRAAWEASAAQAVRFLRRAAALDGAELIAQGATAESATVDVQWGGAMGVDFPEEVRCVLPPPRPVAGSSALASAADTHREALDAAVRYAALRRAVQLLTGELVAARQRLRAVDNRLIPALHSRAEVVRRRLQDEELEESLRLRWAADSATARASHGASASAGRMLR